MSDNTFADMIAHLLDGEQDAETGALLHAYSLHSAPEQPPVVIAEYDPDVGPTRYYRLTVEEVEL